MRPAQYNARMVFRNDSLSLIGLIWRNLYRQPLRTALTILGVSVGVIAIVALGTLVRGLWRSTEEAIHAGGGYVRVHCHGSLSKILEDFVTAGVAMLQPMECPPEGDVLLADAKRRIGSRLVIEGNVQFSRLAGDPPDEFRRLVESSPFSNLPVLDPTTGDAVGVLKVHDVLREIGPQEEFDLTRFTRLALDLEASLSVAQALLAMQSARLPMGFVRDAEGKFLGLVTHKDLVEEIVGELEVW